MKDNSHESGRQFYIPIILTIITVILGLISFHAVFPDYPFFRKLYYTFQLFTMESGDRFYDNGRQTILVTIIFNLASFFAVATLVVTIVLAILSVLRYKYFLSKVRFMRGHTILCGLGRVGEAIADNFPDKKKLVVIEKEGSNENLARLKKQGVRIVEANALDITVLDKTGVEHAKSLIALTGEDFNNLTILNHVIELLRDKNPEEKKVTLLADIGSRNLKAAIMEEWMNENCNQESELRNNINFFFETACSIRAQKGFSNAPEQLKERYEALKNGLLNYNPEGEDGNRGMGNIKLFNINQLAARYIFLNYPPDRFRSITTPNDPAMQILILGHSPSGEELIKLLAQNCHYINRKMTKITFVCIDADIVEEKIISKHKHIREIIDLHSIRMNPLHLTHSLMVENGLTDIDVIYICSSEDRFQASYSSRMWELFGGRVPVIRPFYKSTVLSNHRIHNNVCSFNILNEISKTEYLIDELPDRKAVLVHNHWLRKAIKDYIIKTEDCIVNDKEIPLPKPTLLPWYLVDEEIRDDNRSVVDHINIKLRAVGRLGNPEHYSNPKDSDIDYSFLEDPIKVEQLAEMEHRRWMATKILCGWEYGEKRDVKAKKHESLIDFENLDDDTKNYDRGQIIDMKEIIELV